MSGITDSCRWVAEAASADDHEQARAALRDLYRLLMSYGWSPPKKVVTLLRLHGEVVDTALAQLMDHRPD